MTENWKNIEKNNKTTSEKVKIITNNKYKSLISRVNSLILNYSNIVKPHKGIKKNSKTIYKISKTNTMKLKSLKLMKNK